MTEKPGARVELTIEKMAPEGKGLARSGNRIIFIPHAAPGDRLQVALDRVKEGYALGRIVKVLEPGPGRIVPPCPLHYRPPGDEPRPAVVCGGCDWQHLSAETQLAAKRDLILDCLERIGKLRGVPVAATLASPAAWRYRNKVQVPFAKVGDGVQAGFYSPGSHQIADFDDCPVQPELSVRVVRKVKELAAALRWSVYDESSDRGWLRHLLVRTNADGKALAAVVSKTEDFPGRERFLSAMVEAFPELASVFHNVQPLKTSVVLGPTWKLLRGHARMQERLGKLTLRFSPSAFLQVNTPACEVLYKAVADFLGEDGFRPDLLLDLYCGVGSIALWLAPACRKVLGVEENRQAVEDAWENARLNNVKNARFVAGTAESMTAKLRREFDPFEPGTCAAVVDPPRAGCEETVLRAFSSPAVRRVVYVSCNPPTLARDAGVLAAVGYVLKKVQPVDLFPQTSHIEAVALFERGRRP
ncbi:MAG TPA: 23S rRNA (uracil(1939)-C(5))-methyltransferase RlmD [Elusimicrobiota bacterium]|nr:23S rRNA (uracil(1939)-C(5))-methyltransferase RlmD [Elusimicrobiota bacterium]